jgi:protein-disulfide isomerase
MRHMGHGLGVAALAVLIACGPSPEEVNEIKSRQQDILAKLGDVEKKIDAAAKSAAAARPAPPRRPPVDPNKIFKLPVGSSPVKGPADAKVAIVEFADFQ